MHKSVERVTGMKKFKGDIEGKQFDSTTVYIEAKMDDRHGTRRGRCSTSFNAGNSGVYDRLATIPLPGEFEVEWDTVTNGNKTQQIIVDIRPKAVAPKPAAPV